MLILYSRRLYPAFLNVPSVDKVRIHNVNVYCKRYGLNSIVIKYS